MSLRIATFNLKDFFLPRVPAEAPVVDAKVAYVARELTTADADVVALQEVGEPALLERLLTGEARALGYGPPVVGTEDRRGIRSVILSRVPVLWSQVHAPKYLPFPRFVEDDPEPFGGRIPLRRGIVHVRVESPHLGEVDVLTAHFKSNMGAPQRTAAGAEIPNDTAHGRGEAAVRSLVQRAAEALYLRNLVDDVFDKLPDHAVCVLGDLNDTLDSLPLRVLRGEGAPAPSRLHPCSELLPIERRFSCYHGGNPVLIDHVLVSERLLAAVKSFDIRNDELRYHGPHVADVPLCEDSDHALSVVELAR